MYVRNKDASSALQGREKNLRKRRKSETFMENLVRSAKKGDDQAFARLIQSQTQCMYKVAWAYLKNDEDVADAIQETILTCYQKLPSLRQNKYFKTWMIRILINHCKDMIVEKGRMFSVSDVIESSYEETEYKNCEWKESLTWLDEKYQIVVILYYSKTLTVKEIAALLDISPNTVLTRLDRARKQIKKMYEAGGVIHG